MFDYQGWALREFDPGTRFVLNRTSDHGLAGCLHAVGCDHFEYGDDLPGRHQWVTVPAALIGVLWEGERAQREVSQVGFCQHCMIHTSASFSRL
jgi:hypothetical protein